MGFLTDGQFAASQTEIIAAQDTLAPHLRGPATLQALVRYALQNGWHPSKGAARHGSK